MMAARYACCSADIGLTVVDLAGTAGVVAPTSVIPSFLDQLQQLKKTKLKG